MKLSIYFRCAVTSAVILVSTQAVYSSDQESIERGKYLVIAADCTGCHGDRKKGGALSGGLGIDTPFGTFRTPNITPDKQYGIGNWDLAQFKTALREGIGAEGEYLFPVFPYTSFTKLTDRDIEDMYAYLMSLPAVPVANKPHDVDFPFSWRPLLAFWRILYFTSGPMKADPKQEEPWNRGNYLVNAVTHCGECHTPRNSLGSLKLDQAFSGNIGGPDKQNAPNITPDHETGIGEWSIEDIQLLLKTGMTPESDLIGSGMKAVVRGTSKLTDSDLHAIAVYLRSIPPIHVPPPPPKVLNQDN